MNSQKQIFSQLKISVKESTRKRQQKERINKKEGMWFVFVDIGHYKSSRMICGYKNGSDPVSIARTAQGVV